MAKLDVDVLFSASIWDRSSASDWGMIINYGNCCVTVYSRLFKIWCWFCGPDSKLTDGWIGVAKPLTFARLYLLLIFIFALLYSTFSCGFKTESGTVGIGAAESLYFSVITITTLGYGDISPYGAIARFTAAVEAIAGVAVIGLFLVWLGQDLARQERKLLQEEEQRRRDRALFPFLVKLANAMSQFLSAFDTQPGRPSNSYGYQMHEFGAELVTEATCYFSPADYVRVFGEDPKITLENWPLHLTKWRDAVRELVDGAGPVVDEYKLRVLIDRFYSETTEISRNIPNEQFYAKGGQLVLANARQVAPVIKTAVELRSFICSKSDRTWSGVDFRYRGMYRKHEKEKASWTLPPCKHFKAGMYLGSKFKKILGIFRDD